MSKALKKIPIEIPSVVEDRKITAAARSDPDSQPLTPAQLRAMVPLRSVRGRPKSDNKKLLVSVRYRGQACDCATQSKLSTLWPKRRRWRAAPWVAMPSLVRWIHG